MPNTTLPYDAALFDLDGTVADTERVLFHAWKELVSREGREFAIADYADLIGKTDLQCCRIVSDRFGLGKDPASWHAEYSRIVFRMMDEELELRPGAFAVLEAFHAHGVPTALVTSATEAHATKVLRKFVLMSRFRTIVAADSPGLRARKPHPAPYLLAAERLGVAPTRCIAFEDSPPGVRSAKAAGCFVFAIPHAHSPASALGEAHAILESLWDFRSDLVSFP